MLPLVNSKMLKYKVMLPFVIYRHLFLCEVLGNRCCRLDCRRGLKSRSTLAETMALLENGQVGWV